MEDLLQLRRRHRQIDPIEVIDEDAESEQDPNLPRLHSHGSPDPRPLKAWLIKHLIPHVGHGLMSGQWGAGKTFAFFDLAASLITGQPWLEHVVKRQCGVLLIAAVWWLVRRIWWRPAVVTPAAPAPPTPPAASA